MSKDGKAKTGERDGPRQLPSAVTAERRRLQFFLTYLKQQATKSMVLAIGSEKNRLQEVVNYLRVLSRCDARTDDDLRELMAVWPALDQIYHLLLLAPGASSDIIPEDAWPSVYCLGEGQKAYHAWVRRQVKR